MADFQKGFTAKQIEGEAQMHPLLIIFPLKLLSLIRHFEEWITGVFHLLPQQPLEYIWWKRNWNDPHLGIVPQHPLSVTSYKVKPPIHHFCVKSDLLESSIYHCSTPWNKICDKNTQIIFDMGVFTPLLIWIFLEEWLTWWRI